MDRFRVGVGFRCSNESIHLYKIISIFCKYKTIKLRQTTENPASRKSMLKVYLERQKVMSSGPDQASICDELGVRTC